MSESPNPLKYHYETYIKLDYFVLSADIALLGWTVVNTEWLPNDPIYTWLIGGFWTLIILSVISGIIRQLYNGMAFGVNHQTIYAGELASTIERNTMQGGKFVNQQTGEVSSSDEFKKFATPHREKEQKGKAVYDRLSRKAQFYGNVAICLLIVALFLFAAIKLVVM